MVNAIAINKPKHCKQQLIPNTSTMTRLAILFVTVPVVGILLLPAFN
jgi:hypothetical protein